MDDPLEILKREKNLLDISNPNPDYKPNPKLIPSTSFLAYKY